MSDIRSFKREHELVADDAAGNGDEGGAGAAGPEELDLRAEDDAAVAAALEAEQEAGDDEPDDEEEPEDSEDSDADSEDDDKPKRRRRGRRGGRGRRRKQPLEGTFDHGDEGYGLWLDPAIQDDPVYAEHWAGHRPVTVSVEAERIVISRAGEGEDGGGGEDED